MAQCDESCWSDKPVPRWRVNVCGRTIRVGTCRAYGAHLGGDGAALVGNLAFQRGQVRPRLFQRVFVGARVDFKQELALFAELIVLDHELGNGAIHLRSDADEVRKYFRIIRARVVVGPDNDQCARKEGGGDDANTHDPAETAVRHICFVVGHRISSRIN
jgi:hypothetical protein